MLTARNHLVLEASCHLVAGCLTLSEVEGARNATKEPRWRKAMDLGLKHRNSDVQTAAASATHKLSRLEDCSALVTK